MGIHMEFACSDCIQLLNKNKSIKVNIHCNASSIVNRIDFWKQSTMFSCCYGLSLVKGNRISFSPKVFTGAIASEIFGAVKI